MTNEVSWHVELAVKSGQLENFRALSGEMAEFTQRESDVLCYQCFVSDDGKLVHVYERYADSAAALAHLQNFARNFTSRFLSMVVRRQFAVFGQPNYELRRWLDGYGATYLKPFGDFAYCR